MSREEERAMETIFSALNDANESMRDVQNARAMYDHLYETLADLGYSQEVADDVAAVARDRLMELCGR